MVHLREEIDISLWDDHFIRVSKWEDTLRPMFAISKTQAILLLLIDICGEVDAAGDYAEKVISASDSIDIKSLILELYKRYNSLFISETASKAVSLSISRLQEITKIIRNNHILPPRQLGEQYIRKNVPESLVIFINNYCACNCIYCRVDAGFTDQPGYMDLGSIKLIADQCKELGIQDIELTGGDPFLHPQIMEILRIFAEYAIFPEFSTKVPLNKSHLVRMKEFGYRKIQFSIDSIDKDLLASLTGNRKPYVDNLLNSAVLAQETGMEVIVKSVITSLSVKGLPNLVGYFSSKGIHKYVFQELKQGDRSFDPLLMPDVKDLKALDSFVNRTNAEGDNSISKAFDVEYHLCSESSKKYFRPDCMAGRSGLVIQSDGSYAICGQTMDKRLRFSNIKERSILETWNSEEILQTIYPKREKFRGTVCENCADFEICMRKRCHVRILQETGILNGFDSQCPHQEKNKNQS